MTRRAKLRRIFQLAVEQGVTTQDLLASIEEFTANGNSGIETYVNSQLSTLESNVTPAFDKASVQYHLTKLNELIGN